MNSSIDFGFNPAEVFKLKCEEEHTSAERLTAGHINYTYKVNFAGGKPIILQRVNTNVFRNIKGLMDNIFSVTRFLRGQIIEKGGDYRRGCLRFIKTRDGEHYYLDKEGHCWRAYYYVDNSYCTNTANTPLMFEKSGQAFGRFCMLLASFDGSSLHETIEDFHNTPVRYTQLLDAVARDIAGRKDEYVMPDIGFAREREEQYGRLVNLLAKGRLPVRVTHNDTKINNVVFDMKTHDALCVIDLDTVMPGLCAYDFGDAIRFGANTAAEDEQDLDKVSLNLELFEAYARGYLAEAGSALWQKEKDTLAFGAWLMTMECGMRFLADYLNGDSYFGAKYPEHNLVRARNQFALAADIERKMDKMEEIIAKY